MGGWDNMGEYAIRRADGERIKIGTCESMYYLRADQADQVIAEDGNVDPVADREHLLFRFAWPDEDQITPGDFDNYKRGLRLDRVQAPSGVEHGRVQFRADNGYLVLLPCPESADHYTDNGTGAYSRRLDDNPAVGVALNGYGGSCELVQSRWWEGRLVPVLQCRGCQTAWRLPTIDDAAGLLAELEDKAERCRRDGDRNGTPGDYDRARYYVEIARRIVAGYAGFVRPADHLDAVR